MRAHFSNRLGLAGSYTYLLGNDILLEFYIEAEKKSPNIQDDYVPVENPEQ